MAICLALLAALLYRLRQQGEASLAGVWWGLAAFFFFRAAQSLPRLLGLTAGKRRHKGAGAAATPAAAGTHPG